MTWGVCKSPDLAPEILNTTELKMIEPLPSPHQAVLTVGKEDFEKTEALAESRARAKGAPAPFQLSPQLPLQIEGPGLRDPILSCLGNHFSRASG